MIKQEQSLSKASLLDQMLSNFALNLLQVVVMHLLFKIVKKWELIHTSLDLDVWDWFKGDPWAAG
jgi:hypothetical protein